MIRTAFLETLSPFGKLLLFIAVVLVFTIATSLIGLIAGIVIFNISFTDLAVVMNEPDTPEIVAFLKFYQSISQIGAFIAPSLFFAFMVSTNTSKYLLINRKPKLISVLIVILIVFTILPFNSFLDEINQSMHFPEFLSGVEEWMKDKEEMAAHLTEVFVKTNTIWGLLLNIFIVAMIPAFAEEFLFRGVFLKMFNQWFRNIHVAVIVSAVLFSAFHLQFYGFLPRLLMGIVLGYAFVLTTNLWVPIVLHFVNNSASVIIYYLYDKGHINISAEEFGHSPSIFIIIGSLLISLWLMLMIYQKERSSMVLPD